MNGSELRIQVVTSSMHLYFGWELWNMEHAAEFSRRDEEGPFPSRAVDGQKYGEQRPGTVEGWGGVGDGFKAGWLDQMPFAAWHEVTRPGLAWLYKIMGEARRMECPGQGYSPRSGLGKTRQPTGFKLTFECLACGG
jgi:hypothetical protein